MIQGINVWCRKVAKRKFSWLKPFAEFASGRLQDSANTFRSVLDSYILISKQEMSNTIDYDSGNSVCKN